MYYSRISFVGVRHANAWNQREYDRLKQVKRFMLQNMFPQKG